MGERDYEELFTREGGINLDLGCGEAKRVNWVGMDKRPLKGVDIVHDIQELPWPIPDSICHQVLMSHIWEHIEPKYRVQVMDEVWRVLKPNGRLLLSVPYATSRGAYQDPTHYPCPNELTFTYFDPTHPLWQVYKPKPWRLMQNNYKLIGNMEVILEAVKDESSE